LPGEGRGLARREVPEVIQELWDAGFGPELVSVIPPGGAISPSSRIPPDQRGKCPGRLGPRGWAGYNWVQHQATREDAASWDRAGANAGLRARLYPALDVDSSDPALVETVKALALEHLGWAPVRVGNPPKVLMPYRTRLPFGRMRIWVDEVHLIELLGDGQQYVVGGVHPRGSPYTWDLHPALLGSDGLTEIDAGQGRDFLQRLQARFEAEGRSVEWEGTGRPERDRALIPQESLMGDAGLVQGAVDALPNSSELFPGRDDYLRVGYAIKASLPGDPEAGFELWWSWCSRWEGNARGENDLHTAREDWARMKPPFEVGAQYLYELAREHGGWSNAADEFAVVAEIPEQVSGPVMYSDAAMARRVIAQHGHEIRHCDALGGWYRWAPAQSRWVQDENGVTNLVGELLQEASGEALFRIARPVKAEAVAGALASYRTKQNVTKYLQDSPRVVVQAGEWDKDPWVLGTPAGVVDLRTGEIRDPDPGLLLTRCTRVGPEPDRVPERWLRFMDEITGGDKDLTGYLQRLMGYSLTGHVREHSLHFIWGPGGNGKSVFLGTMGDVMGDYATAAPMETFVSSQKDRHPTELAMLRGARLVTAQETQEGRSWDEARVKVLTGGDPITARYMFRDFFTYAPTFTLVFSGNHQPRIHSLDDGMKRRFHLIPFVQRPKVVDQELPHRLRAEWGGILGWAIRGAVEWARTGLQAPGTVLRATEEYFEGEDPVGRWIESACALEATVKTPMKDLWDSWREWAGDAGERYGSERGLSLALQSRGFERYRDARARGFTGLRPIRLGEGGLRVMV
jgi:putative DNA primase/helicase